MHHRDWIILVNSNKLLKKSSEFFFNFRFSFRYHFQLTVIFWWPGVLNFTWCKACSGTMAISILAANRQDLTIPVWSLSTPAQGSILLIWKTWNGWTLVGGKNPFRAIFFIYLLLELCADSSALQETFSFSQLTRRMQKETHQPPPGEC